MHPGAEQLLQVCDEAGVVAERPVDDDLLPVPAEQPGVVADVQRDPDHRHQQERRRPEGRAEPADQPVRQGREVGRDLALVDLGGAQPDDRQDADVDAEERDDAVAPAVPGEVQAKVRTAIATRSAASGTAAGMGTSRVGDQRPVKRVRPSGRSALCGGPRARPGPAV